MPIALITGTTGQDGAYLRNSFLKRDISSMGSSGVHHRLTRIGLTTYIAIPMSLEYAFFFITVILLIRRTSYELFRMYNQMRSTTLVPKVTSLFHSKPRSTQRMWTHWVPSEFSKRSVFCDWSDAFGSIKLLRVNFSAILIKSHKRNRRPSTRGALMELRSFMHTGLPSTTENRMACLPQTVSSSITKAP